MQLESSGKILGLHPWPMGLGVGMLVVIGFNVWLAFLAVQRYSEPVTTQPYADALHHEKLITAQKALIASGFSARLLGDKDGGAGERFILLEVTTREGERVSGLRVRGRIIHLSGGQPTVQGDWIQVNHGTYRSPGPLEAGLFMTELWIEFEGATLALVDRITLP